MKTTSNVQFTIITGCMNALTGILTNFTHDFEEDPEKSREIYSYVKDASVYNDSTNHRRVFQRGKTFIQFKFLKVDRILQQWFDSLFVITN